MPEFEVEVAGWVRVTKRFRVWDVADGDQAAARAVKDVKAQTGPKRNFKIDNLAEIRGVEVVRVTPLNSASAQADRLARRA